MAGGQCAPPPPPDLPGLSEFGRLRGRPRLPPRLRLDRRHRPFHQSRARGGTGFRGAQAAEDRKAMQAQAAEDRKVTQGLLAALERQGKALERQGAALEKLVRHTDAVVVESKRHQGQRATPRRQPRPRRRRSRRQRGGPSRTTRPHPRSPPRRRHPSQLVYERSAIRWARLWTAAGVGPIRPATACSRFTVRLRSQGRTEAAPAPVERRRLGNRRVFLWRPGPAPGHRPRGDRIWKFCGGSPTSLSPGGGVRPPPSLLPLEGGGEKAESQVRSPRHRPPCPARPRG